MNKDAEIRCVFGRRGSGKSTLAKGMVAGAPKSVVFDPQAEYEGAAVETVADLTRAMRERWAGGFQISYRPPPGREVRHLHAVASVLWQVQAPYETGADPRKLLLLVEEANLSMPAQQLPAECQGINRAINQGRHRGIGLVVVSQRPSLVSATVRANAAETVAFALKFQTDAKTVADLMGPEHLATLRTLPPFHFLAERDGAVRKGKVRQDGTVEPAK